MRVSKYVPECSMDTVWINEPGLGSTWRRMEWLPTAWNIPISSALISFSTAMLISVPAVGTRNRAQTGLSLSTSIICDFQGLKAPQIESVARIVDISVLGSLLPVHTAYPQSADLFHIRSYSVSINAALRLTRLRRFASFALLWLCAILTFLCLHCDTFR